VNDDLGSFWCDRGLLKVENPSYSAGVRSNQSVLGNTTLHKLLVGNIGLGERGGLHPPPPPLKLVHLLDIKHLQVLAQLKMPASAEVV